MKFQSLNSILLLLGLVNGLLLFCALIVRPQNKVANRILAFAILGSAFTEIPITLLTTGQIGDWRLLIRVNFPVSLGVVSLLYAYIEAMTQKDFRFEYWKAKYSLPFVLGVVWYLFFVVFVSDEALWQPGDALWLERYARDVISTVILSIYLVKSFKVIREFEKRIPEYYSSIGNLHASWLKFLLVQISGFWILGVLDIVTGPFFRIWVFVPFATTLSFLALGWFGLTKSAIFFDEAEAGELLRPSGAGRVPVFSELSLESQKQRVLAYLTEERPYLNPQLRLTDLANGLGLKTNEISEVINRGFKATFYDLVNSYRVEEAKRRLVDPKYGHMNILGIANDCGFNSKSAFNEAFRRFAGTTPSSFRRDGQKIP